MVRPISLLIVVGLAWAASPVLAVQQGDAIRQQGEHREVVAATPHNDDLSLDAAALEEDYQCPLEDEQGGPSQADQEAKRRAQKWWLSEDGRAEFKITDQQSKDIEAVFQGFLPQLRQNKADLDKQEKALSQLLNEANSNETLVVQAIDRVEAARGALSRTRTLMLYRMYRLLSAEQRAKVQAYHERKAQESDNRTAQR